MRCKRTDIGQDCQKNVLVILKDERAERGGEFSAEEKVEAKGEGYVSGRTIGVGGRSKGRCFLAYGYARDNCRLVEREKEDAKEEEEC